MYDWDFRSLKPEVKYASVFNSFHTLVPPALLYAFAKQESNLNPNVISNDDGHGLFQLTWTWPQAWYDPMSNTRYAVNNFILPAIKYWVQEGYSGDALIKLVGATYNEGLGAAIKYHTLGNVDIGDTNNYGARLVAGYHEALNEVA